MSRLIAMKSGIEPSEKVFQGLELIVAFEVQFHSDRPDSTSSFHSQLIITS